MNTFTSNFAPHIEAMLEWRTSLGHSLRDMRNAMAGFDRFCSSHHPGEAVLTRELATAWCRDTATGTWGAYRSRAVREFGKYLQLAGVDAFIVPSAWIASPTRDLPHMFTDEELAAFFRAADSFGNEKGRPAEWPTVAGGGVGSRSDAERSEPVVRSLCSARPSAILLIEVGLSLGQAPPECLSTIHTTPSRHA